MTMTKEDVFAQARKGELWAGNLIPGHTGDNAERLVNTTPIDNSPIGHIQASTAADMDAAVAVARTGFESGEWRSEEHTSELQSLMRISYAVFCLQKKKQ